MKNQFVKALLIGSVIFFSLSCQSDDLIFNPKSDGGYGPPLVINRGDDYPEQEKN